MKLRIRIAAILAAAAAALTVTAVPSSAATVNPADRAACVAAYHFHHVMVTPRLYSSARVYWDADELALAATYAASPRVGLAIANYVNRGTGWSWVRRVCAGLV